MHYRHVKNLDAPELAIYTKLNETGLKRLYEPSLGLFIAETDKVIARALQAGYQPVSFLVEEGQEHRFESLWEDMEGEIPVYVAPYEKLVELTGYTLTRGILCAMKRRQLPTMAEVLQGASRVMILEDVMNPTNVGAIFRSAAALGMDAVLLTAGCADPLYRRAIRVAMGTVFQIPWTFLEKELALGGISLLQEQGYTTVAMALLENSLVLEDERLAKAPKLAIVMGTEGEGLRKETITACDYTVMIPMAHGVDSLNVAAASALACYILGKKAY